MARDYVFRINADNHGGNYEEEFVFPNTTLQEARRFAVNYTRKTRKSVFIDHFISKYSHHREYDGTVKWKGHTIYWHSWDGSVRELSPNTGLLLAKRK